MSGSISSKDVKLKLLDEAALVEPFFREDGRLFLKFDRIDFVPYPSPRLVFYWRGKDSLTVPIDGHNPYNDLTISGIEGKSEIFLETE